MSKKKRKPKKFNKIKSIRKANRENQSPYGKSGPHCDKRYRRVKKDSTEDYLTEVENEGE